MPRQPFAGAIPDDRLYCPRHNMWVQELPDGMLQIGASRFGIFLAGEIVAFTSKPKGAKIEIHRGLGTVESMKTVLAVRAPLTFELCEGNEAAEIRPALLNLDPHQHWMVRGVPLNAAQWAAEKAGLIDAAAYRTHILNIEPEARLD